MKKRMSNKSMKGRSAERWSEYLWGKFIDKLSELKSKKEIKRALEKLISVDEKNMILKRLAAIALIRSGKSYREIGEILWLSPNTVSTIKKNILGNHQNYKSYLAFYGGPTEWSSLASNKKSEKTESNFLIDFIDGLFKIFATKGIGIMGDQDFNQRYHK